MDCATQALEKYNIEKDIAGYIKKEFDKKYNPTWHCIVGRNFGSYVTHEVGLKGIDRLDGMNDRWCYCDGDLCNWDAMG